MSGDSLRARVGLASSTRTSRTAPPCLSSSSSGDNTADEDAGTSFADAVTVAADGGTAVDVEETQECSEELVLWNLKCEGKGGISEDEQTC